MLGRLLLVGICLLMNHAIASSPRFTTEAELGELGLGGLQAFWQNTAEEGTFTSQDGLALHFAKLVSPAHDKAIILVNGRTESYLKYQELARDLYQNGYNLYLYDHRGQGLSPRLLDDPLMGHVDNFDDYVQDLEQFVQQQVLTTPHERLYLLAHSMGGTISALWLSDTQVRINAAALASPMMGIYLGPLPAWLAKGLVNVFQGGCRLLGKPACYVPGQGGGYEAPPFAENQLTHSEPRYELFRKLYRDQAGLQLGGPSLQWLAQSFTAGERAIARAHRIVAPLLVLQAGADVVVDNKAQDAFCKALKHCEGRGPRRIGRAAHELFFERDRYRRKALNKVLAFFDSN
ncbi:alpha/beta fold hydrolase [Zobellella aerophila]|uniref:Alpha/beta fold hydrolase n=2 Tax=Zobellella aerophila TaxID=870480 RepID=A0ABP6W183_9GAMM